jgi:hypothetical protein
MENWLKGKLALTKYEINWKVKKVLGFVTPK